MSFSLLALRVAIHMLPDFVLSALGATSDVISDVAPTILRPLLHVAFTFLLN